MSFKSSSSDPGGIGEHHSCDPPRIRIRAAHSGIGSASRRTPMPSLVPPPSRAPGWGACDQ
eukprot:4508824-Pyramimonas_sp.AAC.1